MSRMTKFLRQTCQLQCYKETTEGVADLNEFGELQYLEPVVLKCRHEVSTRDIQTYSGSIVRSNAVYYLDDKEPIRVDYKIDGRVVISVAGYVDALGNVIGYEVYV